jgi:hypothetical protein
MQSVRNWGRTQNPEHEADESLPAYQEFVDDPPGISAPQATGDAFEEFEQEGARFQEVRRARHAWEVADAQALLDLPSTSTLDDNTSFLDDKISRGNTSYNLSSGPASIDGIPATQSVVDAASATSNEGSTRDSLDDISAQSLSDASSTDDEGYSLRRTRVAEGVADQRARVADQPDRVAAVEAELDRRWWARWQPDEEHDNEGSTRDPLDDGISATQSLTDASSTDEVRALRRAQVAEGAADRDARITAWRDTLQARESWQADARSNQEHDSDSLEL